MRGDGRCAYAERLRAISIHASPRGATVLAKNTIPCYPISIHSPPRGATRMRCASCKRTSFQFTPLREGRRLWFFWPAAALYFNSRPSARGDTGLQSNRDWEAYFNSRPSARGDAVLVLIDLAGFNFNSRPSARGNFAINAVLVQVVDISIHAPPRGATGRCRPAQRTTQHFNSRPSARGDGDARAILIEVNHISIHAPPRGAT